MTESARRGVVAIVALLAGCGGRPSTSDPGPAPPHGGNLVAMPGGKGYVEVVKKAGATPEAAFYFLDASSVPVTPAPSAGTLVFGKKTIALKAEGDALVTPPGPPLFKAGDVDGTLMVVLDGKEQTIPLGVR